MLHVKFMICFPDYPDKSASACADGTFATQQDNYYESLSVSEG